MKDKAARIFNIQKYNIYDGPGVRTLIFFQGCPLRCQWCSNPEGMEQRCQVLFKADACRSCGACVPVCPISMHALCNGQHKLARHKNCLNCGRCAAVCPQAALSIAGMDKTVAELMDIIEEDRIFYEFSGGGVTLGGGEVLLQADAAAALLQACRQAHIHTTIETCGYGSQQALQKVAAHTDLFLFDLKHMDSGRHQALTGAPNALILQNLTMLLQTGYPVRVRMPLLKNFNDQLENIAAVIAFLLPFQHVTNFLGIDLLPYHKMGVNKYKQLGKDYPIVGDPSLSREDLRRIAGWLKQYDFSVKVIDH